jgi:hypothetical protein
LWERMVQSWKWPCLVHRCQKEQKRIKTRGLTMYILQIFDIAQDPQECGRPCTNTLILECFLLIRSVVKCTTWKPSNHQHSSGGNFWDATGMG